MYLKISKYKVKIDHLECFIKPFKNEFELKKCYFDQIENKIIYYKNIFSRVNNYYLILLKKEYMKIKYSFNYDLFLPVQSLMIDDLLEKDEGKYVFGSDFGNYIFYKDENFVYSGVRDDEKFENVDYLYSNEELSEKAKVILENKKNNYIKI